MTSGQTKMTARCKHCGSDTFRHPSNPTDQDMVICASCGAEVGRWGDIKRALVESAKEHRDGIVRDFLEKTKNLRPK